VEEKVMSKLLPKDDKEFAKLMGIIFLLANIGLGLLSVGLMYILVISKHVG